MSEDLEDPALTSFPTLEPYGWDGRWEALLADMPPGLTPGRVVRHDGQAITVALPDGERMLMLQRRVDPEPAVGDWVAVDRDEPIGVLPRTSLLRRRAAVSDTEQVMAANIDLLLLVCGLDRPVKAGRIQRGATLAWTPEPNPPSC